MRQLLVGISLLTFFIFSLYAVAVNNFLLAAITALFYAIDPLYYVIVSSYSVRIVSDEIRGRIASLTRLVTLAAYSFGFFITGYLLQYLGSKWTVGVFSALLFALFLVSVLNKSLAGQNSDSLS
jgi:MFS family permease